MNHPYELLADLVDGTLDEENLARVQAHLDGCVTCREEVADAVAGAEAARSLPLEAPPADLHRRAVAAGGGRGTPPWYRWASVAAAAAVVAAVAIALPNVGGDTPDVAREDSGGQAGTLEAGASADGVAVSVEDRDYDAADLEDLARSGALDQVPSSQDASRSSEAAVRCVSRAFSNQRLGRLTRLIQARFEGEEAYIAVYREGPGAEQERDLVNVLAASRDDCSFLSLAYSKP